MPEIIAVTLITQEQMNVDTAFDFICLAGISMSDDQVLCIISPQRARKEIAKREAIGIAAAKNCKSILFIRDGVRFIPEALNTLVKSKKDVIGCTTNPSNGRMNSDFLLVNMVVFEKLEKPFFAATQEEGTINSNPDYYHFFESCGKSGIDVFSEDKLSNENLAVTSLIEGEVSINARKLEGRNPMGETIAICLPSPDLVYTHTVCDLAELVAVNLHHFKRIIVINVKSDEIETARNISTMVAQSEKATKILFVDSDMRFPKTALLRLLKRKKDIIGINAAKRAEPGNPIFRKNLFGRAFNYKKGDTEQVGFIGMGFTLIDMKVFDKVQKPWFYANYKIDSDFWRGEDYAFCWEAKQKGYSIWCDVGLSKEIGHIGAKTFYLEK
jgi:hypothetical protein